MAHIGWPLRRGRLPEDEVLVKLFWKFGLWMTLFLFLVWGLIGFVAR